MRMRMALVLVMLVGACGGEEEVTPLCAELGAPDALLCDAQGLCDFEGAACLARVEFDVTWSMSGTSDSRGVPDPVQCTETISHPCPFLLYTRTLRLEGARAIWMDATGGTDEAGVAAEDRQPWVDTVTFDGGLALPDRGDDGGLRHAVTLTSAPDGYEGNVAWTLFTVAGTTTFHVRATRRD